MSKHTKMTIGIVLGIIFIGIAIMYFAVPAGSLPPYSIIGYLPGSSHIHATHAIAALILGVLAFLYAWFASGEKAA